MKNLNRRYVYLKKLYPDYLIVFVNYKKNKVSFETFGFDNLILNYLKLSELDKHSISYIIVDNLEIIEKRSYIYNNYYRYKKMILVKNLLKKVCS